MAEQIATLFCSNAFSNLLENIAPLTKFDNSGLGGVIRDSNKKQDASTSIRSDASKDKGKYRFDSI